MKTAMEMETELQTLLNDASNPAKKPKISAAERPALELEARAMGPERGLAFLRAYLAVALPLPSYQAPRTNGQSRTALTADQQRICKVLRIPDETFMGEDAPTVARVAALGSMTESEKRLCQILNISAEDWAKTDAKGRPLEQEKALATLTPDARQIATTLRLDPVAFAAGR